MKTLFLIECILRSDERTHTNLPDLFVGITDTGEKAIELINNHLKPQMTRKSYKNLDFEKDENMVVWQLNKDLDHDCTIEVLYTERVSPNVRYGINHIYSITKTFLR